MKTVAKRSINWLHSLPNVVFLVLFFLFCATMLVAAVRGLPGNPTLAQLNTLQWKDNGPLELSPERGKYALLYAIAENHTFTFSPDIARFAAPDVGFLHNNYVSLFPPGVTYAVLGGYYLGRMVGLAQVGTFLVISLFALLNAVLIRAIAIRLGANKTAATLAAFVFLFATPAFTYAGTLYQHHITTFLLLLAIYVLLRFNSFWSLCVIWIICGASIMVDSPNAVFFSPIGLVGLYQMVKPYLARGRFGIRLSPVKLLSVFAILIPVAFYLWFNLQAYGNPFQLSGTVDRALSIQQNGKPNLEKDVYLAELKKSGQKPPATISKNAVNFFQSRLLLSGFNVLLFSRDRGVLTYTPIMFLAIVGILMAIKQKMRFTGLLVSIIGLNILLYAMWDDPYGGWAFGARYLIPSYALLSVFLGYFLTYWKRSNIFLLLFFILFTYSVSINTLGAITSSMNPPAAEAEQLSITQHRDVKSDYFNNIDELKANQVKSFVYQTVAKPYMSGVEYYELITLLLIMTGAIIIMYLQLFSKEVAYDTLQQKR